MQRLDVGLHLRQVEPGRARIVLARPTRSPARPLPFQYDSGPQLFAPRKPSRLPFCSRISGCACRLVVEPAAVGGDLLFLVEVERPAEVVVAEVVHVVAGQPDRIHARTATGSPSTRASSRGAGYSACCSATQSGTNGISLLMIVMSAAASSGPTCRARKPGIARLVDGDRGVARHRRDAGHDQHGQLARVAVGDGDAVPTSASASCPRRSGASRYARAVSGHSAAWNRLSTGDCPSSLIARSLTRSWSNGMMPSPILSPQTAASTPSAGVGLTLAPGWPSSSGQLGQVILADVDAGEVRRLARACPDSRAARPGVMLSRTDDMRSTGVKTRSAHGRARSAGAAVVSSRSASCSTCSALIPEAFSAPSSGPSAGQRRAAGRRSTPRCRRSGFGAGVAVAAGAFRWAPETTARLSPPRKQSQGKLRPFAAVGGGCGRRRDGGGHPGRRCAAPRASAQDDGGNDRQRKQARQRQAHGESSL